MVGYLRRWRAAEGYGQPLEANVLVVDDNGTVGALEVAIALPMKEPPTVEEIDALRDELAAKVAALKAADAPQDEWNPVDIHVAWAERVRRRLLDGSVAREGETILQVL